MATENAILSREGQWNGELMESFDFAELEEKLQSQLDEELANMQFLAEEKEKIGNPENLANVIMNVVWEQFLNQIAVTAGEDFIKENNGLHLDLRDEAHIQTTENFAQGKIATHTKNYDEKCDFQQRYDDWQAKFQKDESGKVVMHPTRTGEEPTLVKGARKSLEPKDAQRPQGSAARHTDVDHTISAAEIIRDPAANAHMTLEEQVAFANSDVNLNEIDASLNRSKGDKSMTEWLDNPNAKGQKPNEIWDISAEDDAKLRQKDAEARAEYEKQKKEAEQRSIEAGKESQREEAFRIGKEAFRAVLMQLLADLLREIFGKLVKWFKSADKALDTLLDSLKEAILSFIGKMKTHLVNAGSVVFSTVATAIMGPVFRTLKKVWMLLKQSWTALKSAVAYLKDPANKGKPINILLMEVGKLVIGGLTGAGALLLSDAVEKGLMTIPIFAIEIPMLGSLASILGMFLGGVAAGIIGAIAINIIEKRIEKNMKNENINARLKKGNEVLNLQHRVQLVNEVKLEHTKSVVANHVYDRHTAASNMMADSVENIRRNCMIDESCQGALDDVDKLLCELEG